MAKPSHSAIAEQYTEVLPSHDRHGSEEVGGILLCLSCHDGNLTPNNMMANQSYEQKIGLLTNTAYGSNPIPTLLGNDGTGAGNYTNDHPVGPVATISSRPRLGLTSSGYEIQSPTPAALCPVRRQLWLPSTGAW